VLLKNADGYTALHLAVQVGFAELTRLVLEVGGTQALYMENGVGETPLEIATQQELLWRTVAKLNQGGMIYLNNAPDLKFNSASVPPAPFDETRKAQVTRLRGTLDELVADGRLRSDTKLYNELFAFADRMDTKVVPPATKRDQEEDKDPKDTVDKVLTLQLIREAVASQPGARSLLHLLDVHKSVQKDLDRPAARVEYRRRRSRRSVRKNDKGGLEPEQDEEEEQRKKSLVFSIDALNNALHS
jgi:hypothetical protein